MLWTHSIISVFVMWYGVWMVDYFASIVSSNVKEVATRTLFIRRISCVDLPIREALFGFFQKRFPRAKITGMQFVYNGRNLRNTYQSYLNTIDAKCYCRDYFEKKKKRCLVRPYSLGRFGVVFCCCNCCPTVDGFDYYDEQAKEIKDKVELECLKVQGNPNGSAFVTFQDEMMAHK